MKREHGFTLIELLIAMAIFLIVGVMFLQIFLFYIRYSMEVKSKEIAQALLTEHMSRLLATDYYLLTPGTENVTVTREGINYSITENIIAGVNYKDLTVSVSWNLFGKNFSRRTESRRSPP